MGEEDYKSAKGQDLPEDDLDRALNVALARYATVEAREGLEERILANLRAEQSAVPRSWWKWGIAAVFAAAIIAIALWAGRHTQPTAANHAPDQNVAKPVVPDVPRPSTHRSSSRVPGQRARKHASPTANPKLDQFPSPHPLSEQEKILAMYVNEDPEHAALIAEARMEELRRDEAERVRVAAEDVRDVGR